MESLIRKSANCTALYEALAAFQGVVENAKKDKVGEVRGESKKTGQKYSYKFQYADLAAVLDATRPHLSKFGLSVVQPTVITADNQLRIITHLAHKSGQWMEADYPVCRIGDMAHSDMGGALSYARRYAYCSLLELASETDTGSTEAGASSMPFDDDLDPVPKELRKPAETKQSGPPRTVPPKGATTPAGQSVEFDEQIAAAADVPALEEIRRKIGAAKLPTKQLQALETAYYNRKTALLKTAKQPQTDDEWLHAWTAKVEAAENVDDLFEVWLRAEAHFQDRPQQIRQALLTNYEARKAAIS